MFQLFYFILLFYDNQSPKFLQLDESIVTFTSKTNVKIPNSNSLLLVNPLTIIMIWSMNMKPICALFSYKYSSEVVKSNKRNSECSNFGRYPYVIR